MPTLSEALAEVLKPTTTCVDRASTEGATRRRWILDSGTRKPRVRS